MVRPMKSQYLGRVPLTRALAQQEQIVSEGGGLILGFEAEPVVTLGVRAGPADAVTPPGFDVVRVDRGGQATLHNPGQLVIFPVVDTRVFGGPRDWICHLVRTTQRTAARLGHTLIYDEHAPGLYDADGAKVAALGVRLRRGISTHGIAINVRNDLTPFARIRACGRIGAAVAHLETDLSLPALLDIWVEEFTADSAGTVKNLESNVLSCPRLGAPATTE